MILQWGCRMGNREKIVSAYIQRCFSDDITRYRRRGALRVGGLVAVGVALGVALGIAVGGAVGGDNLCVGACDRLRDFVGGEIGPNVPEVASGLCYDRLQDG